MADKILIVDDEQDILDLLQFNLKSEGYETLTAIDGEQALNQALMQKPDLIILDIMLPGKDGWEVLKELRRKEETRHIPVIFLTAKDSEIDEVVGLELGADDYIIKPISIRKFIARVKMVLRKSKQSAEEAQTISIDGIEIDLQGYQVQVGGRKIDLTKKEFQILVYLAQRPGRVITREILLNEIWGDDVVVIDRTVDVHIRKIREKFGPQHMSLIETVKGVGYRFKVE